MPHLLAVLTLESFVRLTANVSPAVAEQLSNLAEQLGTTKTEALNQAIATASTLYNAASNGAKVVIKEA